MMDSPESPEVDLEFRQMYDDALREEKERLRLEQHDREQSPSQIIQCSAQRRLARSELSRQRCTAQKRRQTITRESAGAMIQAGTRGFLARKHVATMRRQQEDEESTIVQTSMRGWECIFLNLRTRRRMAAARHKQAEEEASIVLQASMRGRLARKNMFKECQNQMEEEANIVVHASVRGLLARKNVAEKQEEGLNTRHKTAEKAKSTADAGAAELDKAVARVRAEKAAAQEAKTKTEEQAAVSKAGEEASIVVQASMRGTLVREYVVEKQEEALNATHETDEKANARADSDEGAEEELEKEGTWDTERGDCCVHVYTYECTYIHICTWDTERGDCCVSVVGEGERGAGELLPVERDF